MLATIGSDVDYHDGLVSFGAVKIDDLVLSTSPRCDGTLADNGASPLLESTLFLFNELGLLIYFPSKHLFSL